MSLKLAVIDDERASHKIVQNYLNRLELDSKMVSYSNPIKAFKSISSNPKEYDLIILDIEMPNFSGVQFIDKFKFDIPIIVATAFPEYAVKCFNFNVIDYLIKPFSFDDFRLAIEKHKSTSLHRADKRKIFIRTDGMWLSIKIDDLLFIKGLGDYVEFHTINEKIVSHCKLKDLESEFLSYGLVRVHRSYICNLSLVEKITTNNISIGGENLPIGRSYKKNLNEYVKQFLNVGN